MNEFTNKLKEISNLSELEGLNNINSNILLYAIAKSGRYELLNGANIKLDLSDNTTLEKLIDFLLSDEDILYFMHRNGFAFSKDELNVIFIKFIQKEQDSYKFDCFFRDFFDSKDEINDFIKEHEVFFENYISEKKQSISYVLNDYDNFIKLVLKNNHTELINNIENYSVANLKLLVQSLKHKNQIPYYLGNDRFAQHLFDLKEELNPDEFCTLIDLLKEKSIYSRNNNNSNLASFSTLINENIDYLIEIVSQRKLMPKCLVESSIFRDECIKRNRIDLAVKCILPSDIMKNEDLVNAYCNELNIDFKIFYEKIKWLLSYYEKNNNIFNSFIATSLKNNIFSLNTEHFERFINDVEIQMAISKLDDKELAFLSKILNIYNYKDYDISPMIVNIINNINNYHELIHSLDLENIAEYDLRKLVSILQLPNNQYQIKNLSTLQNYDNLKKQYFVNNYSNSLISSKDNLLKILFNIDLNEAEYINYRYCYDNDDNCMLENLQNSELPQQIYDYLVLINKIVECSNQKELIDLYNSLNNAKIYELEIPFESYLRAKYTQLYSQSLYRINERNKVYGPKDSVLKEINYKGKKIQVNIPRANFNFLVHCVGSCSLASDVTDSNYRNDWLDRPQLQDHFVACSYINEKGIFSIRSQGSIIFGFDTLESGSILGMGNTDIDSIGRYANAYSGSRELQKGNGTRARYFVPSEILKTINKRYNEIVIERRNTDRFKNENFKKKPDYIIMMAESMEQDNFNYLDTLYQNQLSFLSEDDKKVIRQIGNASKLKNFLRKYEYIISQNANIQGIPLNDMANKYVNLIMKAKYFEDCLKASSEFDIPLVVIDKTYYFNKMLANSVIYDEATIVSISELYSQADETKKKQLFNMVASGKDITQFIQPKADNAVKIEI